MGVPDGIADRKARLDALRPLHGPSLAALDRWFDVELTFTSNAIEGSTLTRTETAVVVEKGITIGGKPLRDHLEALDHMDALALVRALASRSEPIREFDLREIHRLVLARSDPAEAGSYSRRQRLVLGSAAVFPPPSSIAPAMGDLARWLTEAPDGPDTAFEAHYRLVTIHPFSDGNGRTARLLMNLLLLRAGYPPVTIGPEQRTVYLDALEARQTTDEADAWRELMMSRLLASLDLYLSHLSGLEDPRS